MAVLDNLKKMAEQGCTSFTCGECPMKRLCVTGDNMDLIAQEFLNLLSYDSDLNKCEVGDWVWEQRIGDWTRIESIISGDLYSINTSTDSYTLEGKVVVDDAFPSLFVKPPLCFNPKPKPETESILNEGDRVLVRNSLHKDWTRAVFCQYDPANMLKYITYADGKDAWTSEGKIEYWKYCKKVEEE